MRVQNDSASTGIVIEVFMPHSKKPMVRECVNPGEKRYIPLKVKCCVGVVIKVRYETRWCGIVPDINSYIYVDTDSSTVLVNGEVIPECPNLREEECGTGFEFFDLEPFILRPF